MIEMRIPPALSNAFEKFKRPAPRAAFTMRNTAKYHEMPDEVGCSLSSLFIDSLGTGKRLVLSFVSISLLLLLCMLWFNFFFNWSKYLTNTKQTPPKFKYAYTLEL